MLLLLLNEKKTLEEKATHGKFPSNAGEGVEDLIWQISDKITPNKNE